jgi:hypothetical protein
MRNTVLLLLTVVALVLPRIARADWDVEDAKFVQLPDVYGWDVDTTTPRVLADDFLCRDTEAITDIHFWGSWKDDLIGEITRIHLSIHADIPAEQSPSGYSMPGEVLWERDFFPQQMPNIVVIEEWFEEGTQGWYDPLQGEVLQENHHRIWLVNIFLPEWDVFQQEGSIEDPIVYWLDIQVDVEPVAGAPQPVFGWKTSFNHWNDDAVWGAPDVGWQELIDPLTEESIDMAFAITSDVIIPEPGLMVVSGLAAVLMLARRRKR